MSKPTNIQDKLNEKVTINLDTIEYETPDEKFSFVLAGRRMELDDPNLVDWKILAELGSPVELLRHVVQSDEDRQWLRDHKLPIEGLKRLMDAYARHYGLPEMGKGAGSVI
jgi:hypothetical protein